MSFAATAAVPIDSDKSNAAYAEFPAPLLSRLAALVRNGLDHIRARQRRRATETLLLGFDEHTLRDIGLHRGKIVWAMTSRPRVALPEIQHEQGSRR